MQHRDRAEQHAPSPRDPASGHIPPTRPTLRPPSSAGSARRPVRSCTYWAISVPGGVLSSDPSLR
ncbi:MAG: hypothetical protein AVDCRST_MAG66-347 [uncultured Pseudonocardia sp.]|uniref:Uncharacterized protein n=1 Tax=uncultured Pseudonocardia sp. TaxID=211455 RepID=A0A6J4N912_9PSEU|nr:MAG: hypothetical protein AVDCRST_MAG66-347 [uncultured Pseudonocardia sp.]